MHTLFFCSIIDFRIIFLYNKSKFLIIKYFFDEINKNIFTNKYYYAIMIIRKIDIEF